MEFREPIIASDYAGREIRAAYSVKNDEGGAAQLGEDCRRLLDSPVAREGFERLASKFQDRVVSENWITTESSDNQCVGMSA